MSVSTRLLHGRIVRVASAGENVVLENLGDHWRLTSQPATNTPPNVFVLSIGGLRQEITCEQVAAAKPQPETFTP